MGREAFFRMQTALLAAAAAVAALLFLPLPAVSSFALTRSGSTTRTTRYNHFSSCSALPTTNRSDGTTRLQAVRVGPQESAVTAFTTSSLPVSEEIPLVEYDLTEGIGISKSDHNIFSNVLDNPSKAVARVLILAASAVYGTNFAIVKLLDEQIPFAVSAALRFSLAAVVVSAIVLRGENNENEDFVGDRSVLKQERTAATFAGMEIGGWYCLGYLCQAVGLQTADASKSAFFNALAVIIVPLLDTAFRGKHMGSKEVFSVALAIAGVGLLQLGPSILSGVPVSLASGDVFCLAQAVLFGIGYWRLEAISGEQSTQAGRVTVGQLAGVALGSTVFCGVTTDLPSLSQLQGWLTDPFTVGSLAWTALVSTALALYLETVALKAVSAAELTVLMTSVSIFGSGFAYVTMGETMSPIGMAGGLMILVGCVFSSLGGDGDVASEGKAGESPVAFVPQDVALSEKQ